MLGAGVAMVAVLAHAEATSTTVNPRVARDTAAGKCRSDQKWFMTDPSKK